MNINLLINRKSGAFKGEVLLKESQNIEHKDRKNLVVQEIDFHSLVSQLKVIGSGDIVIIGGGDGTISTILPLLKNLNVKIGIIPLGTANDLSLELKLPNELKKKCLSEILRFYCEEAKVKSFALWDIEFNDKIKTFVNYVSFGFDAKVADQFAKMRSKNHILTKIGVLGNRLAYFIASISCLNTTAKINFENKFLVGRSIIISNIRSYMGIGLSNKISSPYDGKIELTPVRSIIGYLWMILKTPRRSFASEDSLNLRFESPTFIQIDGEPYGQISGDCQIKYSGTIEILVPK